MKVKNTFSDLRINSIVIIITAIIIISFFYNNYIKNSMSKDTGVDVNDEFTDLIDIYGHLDGSTYQGTDLILLIKSVTANPPFDALKGSILIQLDNGHEISVYDSEKHITRTADLQNISPASIFTGQATDNSDGSKTIFFTETKRKNLITHHE